MTEIRTPVDPEGPLLVIGAGLGRTGTNSLKHALETLLGQPCYHMFELMEHHPPHGDLWIELFEKWQKNPEHMLPHELVGKIFLGYRAVVDYPACTVYRKLLEVYPQAKVVLTVRDKHKWLDSVRKTIYPKRTPIQILKRLFHLDDRLDQLDTKMWHYAFGAHVNLDDDDQMLVAFERWNAAVVASVPQEKLLVYKITEGWEPLCRFLNVGIPEVPFPHRNDLESFQVTMNRLAPKTM